MPSGGKRGCKCPNFGLIPGRDRVEFYHYMELSCGVRYILMLKKKATPRFV